MNNSNEVLQTAINKTDSEVTLVFIIVVVAMVLLIAPMYVLIIKSQNTRQEKYIERENNIIHVITSNTEVMAGLKATLENNGQSTVTALSRIHDRIDDQNNKMLTFGEQIVKIITMLEKGSDSHE
jgi:preprotein translocase subunit YajC